jgi:hypothetical protein
MPNETPAPVPGDTDDLDAFAQTYLAKPPAPKEEEAKPVVDKKAAVEAEADEAEENETAEEVEGHAEDEESEEGAADDTDAGDEDEEAPEEGKKPEPKKSRIQERIDELTAQRKAAERATEEAVQKTADLERRLRELETAQKQPENQDTKATEAKGAPTPDDKSDDGTEKYPLGEFDPTYIRDLTRWTIAQETTRAKIEAEEQARAQEQTRAQTQLQQEWQARVEAVKTELPDFVENVKILDGTFSSIDKNYGDYLSSTLMSMEHGPEVLYYLSNNLPEARKIVDSGAVKATIALGRLEAQFAAKAVKGPPAEKKVKITKAKEPAPQVRGTSGKFAVAPDTDDLDAFAKTFLRKKA